MQGTALGGLGCRRQRRGSNHLDVIVRLLHVLVWWVSDVIGAELAPARRCSNLKGLLNPRGSSLRGDARYRPLLLFQGDRSPFAKEERRSGFR